MDKLFIKDFRVFDKEYSFDISPITILTGKNNSGKSSLIKAILLLADFIASKNQTVIQFNGNFRNTHKLSSYQNSLNNQNPGLRPFSLGFQKDLINYNFIFHPEPKSQDGVLKNFEVYKENENDRLKITRQGNELLLQMKLNYLNRLYNIGDENRGDYEDTPNQKSIEQTRQEIKEIKEEIEQLKKMKSAAQSNSEIAEFASEEQQKKSRLNLLLLEEKIFTKTRSKDDPEINQIIPIGEDELIRLSLDRIITRGMLKYSDRDGSFRFSKSEIFRSSRHAMDQLLNNLDFQVVHLGPNRTHQSRLYINSNSASEINDIINTLSVNPIKKGTAAYNFIQKWMDKDHFDIGEKYWIENVEQVASYLYLEKNEKKYNLVDTGFGTGQILTLLLKLGKLIDIYNRQHKIRQKIRHPFNKRKPVVFLIEEPESNLHPKLQSLLAEMFMEAIQLSKDYLDLKFIIETHSEYFIRKLQLLTAQEKIATDDTIIYYMDFQSNEESKYKEIRIESDGKLSDSFGEGFYDEAGMQAIELNRLIRSKK